MDINNDKIHQLSREFFKDRSKKNPEVEEKDSDLVNSNNRLKKIEEADVISESERLKKSNYINLSQFWKNLQH